MFSSKELPIGYPLWLIRNGKQWFVIKDRIGKVAISEKQASEYKNQDGVKYGGLAGYDECYSLP